MKQSYKKFHVFKIKLGFKKRISRKLARHEAVKIIVQTHNGQFEVYEKI